MQTFKKAAKALYPIYSYLTEAVLTAQWGLCFPRSLLLHLALCCKFCSWKLMPMIWSEQAQPIPERYSKRPSPYCPRRFVKNGTRVGLRPGCSVLETSTNTGVWTAARGTAEDPSCVSGRARAGLCTASPLGGTAVASRIHLAFIPKFQSLYLG